MELLEDKDAYDLYNKLDGAVKEEGQNDGNDWTNEEVSLLNWSIHRYCKDKGITQHDLNPKNWRTISGYVPGRSDKDCEKKFNNGLYHIIDEDRSGAHLEAQNQVN